MTIVLTNDDGIDAPGIRALQQAVQGQGFIIAPMDQLSGCGHQVTTSKPLEVSQVSAREYAVGGTPADCTRLALTHLCPDVSWVLSGINAGGNLGVDVYISGTVAAVREASLHGIPSIAISHWIKHPLVIDWDWASYWTAKVLAELFARPCPPKTFWNVNLPHLKPGDRDPEIIMCSTGQEPLPVKYRVQGNYYYYEGVYPERERIPGSDVDVCFSGDIAVCQIQV